MRRFESCRGHHTHPHTITIIVCGFCVIYGIFGRFPLPFQQPRGNGHPAVNLTGGVVHPHLQPEHLEQPAQQGFWDLGEVDLADRQAVEQVGALPRGLRSLHFGQPRLLLLAFEVQGRGASADVPRELRVRSFQMFKTREQRRPASSKGINRPMGGCDFLFVVLGFLFLGIHRNARQPVAARRPEDLVIEEPADRLDQLILADPVTGRVALGDVALGRLADVVGRADAVGLAEQPSSAVDAHQKRPQDIGALRLLTRLVQPTPATGPFPMSGDLLRRLERFDRDQRLVGGSRGPDPRLRRVGLATIALGRTPVPHHVSGVLGVGEDLADGRVRPASHCARRVYRLGWRIPGQILVQAVGDGLVTETLLDAPSEDHGDHRAAYRIRTQEMLGCALRPACRYRVRDLLGQVAVWWLADVEALLGVGLEATPGFLEEFENVPLGDTLLDAAGEDLRRAFAIEVDRFVRCKEQNAGLFELVLDQGTGVGAASNAVDRLADHHVEAPVRALGLSKQVLDAALAWNWDGEALVPTPPATAGQVLAA
nr:hypothetical protein [Actinomadura rupiterrae]